MLMSLDALELLLLLLLLSEKHQAKRVMTNVENVQKNRLGLIAHGLMGHFIATGRNCL